MNQSAEAALQNLLVRMVVPMRREFGCTIDVHEMRRDAAYARGVIEQAMTSREQRLRDYAIQVEQHLRTAADEGGAAAQPPRIDLAIDSASLPRKAAAAARGALDALGADAERLAMRMERAPDGRALEALIADARIRIVGLRGEAAAARYLQSIVDAAPTGADEKDTGPSVSATLRGRAAVAARQLIEAIGPIAEPLALRIERTTDASKLMHLVAEARDCIASLAGPDAASAYMKRVGATPR